MADDLSRARAAVVQAVDDMLDGRASRVPPYVELEAALDAVVVAARVTAPRRPPAKPKAKS